MKRVSLKIDVLSLDKKRFVEETFINKEGKTINRKNMLVDVVFSEEPRTLTSGDTWELQNVGFITETPTKDERKAKTNRPIIGSATAFKDKVAVPSFNRDSQGKEIEAEEIPW